MQFHKIKRLVLLDETRRDERSQENWSLYREVERSQISLHGPIVLLYITINRVSFVFEEEGGAGVER